MQGNFDDYGRCGWKKHGSRGLCGAKRGGSDWHWRAFGAAGRAGAVQRDLRGDEEENSRAADSELRPLFPKESHDPEVDPSFVIPVPVSWTQAQTAPQSQSRQFLPGRLANIRHGINLSEWFAQVYDPKGYTKEHFENWTTASDIALIKSAGFDHVRLSVNPQPMMDAGRSHNGSAEYFGYLDAAVKMILDAGLAVEIDMHPDSDFKERLAKEDDFVERFADLWSTVAQHYASRDPDRVFFEILNEPRCETPIAGMEWKRSWPRPFGEARREYNYCHGR